MQIMRTTVWRPAITAVVSSAIRVAASATVASASRVSVSAIGTTLGTALPVPAESAGTPGASVPFSGHSRQAWQDAPVIAARDLSDEEDAGKDGAAAIAAAGQVIGKKRGRDVNDGDNGNTRSDAMASAPTFAAAAPPAAAGTSGTTTSAAHEAKEPGDWPGHGPHAFGPASLANLLKGISRSGQLPRNETSRMIQEPLRPELAELAAKIAWRLIKDRAMLGGRGRLLPEDKTLRNKVLEEVSAFLSVAH